MLDMVVANDLSKEATFRKKKQKYRIPHIDLEDLVSAPLGFSLDLV